MKSQRTIFSEDQDLPFLFYNTHHCYSTQAQLVSVSLYSLHLQDASVFDAGSDLKVYDLSRMGSKVP